MPIQTGEGAGPGSPLQNQHCVLRTRLLLRKEESSGQPSLRKETQPLLSEPSLSEETVSALWKPPA